MLLIQAKGKRRKVSADGTCFALSETGTEDSPARELLFLQFAREFVCFKG